MRKKIIIPVIVAIIVVGGVSAFFLVPSGEVEEEGYTPSVGDNVKYKVNGFAALMGSFEGTIEIRFTTITENSYTYTLIPKGDLSAFMDQESKTVGENEPVTESEIVEKGTFMGTKSVVTDIGTIEADYYRLENQTEEGLENTDYYLENETNIPIKMRINSPEGMTMSMIISSTNIDPLREKFE